MPGRDGTGPIGTGSMTGGGFGNCAGAKASQGYGRGMGSGYGKGNGRDFNAQFRTSNNNLAPLQQDELTLLKNQAAVVKTHLGEIKERITKLEKE